MRNMKLPGSRGYTNQMAIHTTTQKEEVILEK